MVVGIARRGLGALAIALVLIGSGSAVVLAAGPATQLDFGSGGVQDAPAGATIPAITVRIEDASGNLVNTDNSTMVTLAIAANPAGGTLSGTTTVQAVSGRAKFTGLSIDNAGNGYTLQATSSPVLTAATSNAFDITASGTHLVFGTEPTTAAAGAVMPAFTVQVEDGSNQVVTSSTAVVSLSISNNPGGGTLSGTTSVAAVNGIATFNNVSINNPGVNYTLDATANALASAFSTPFTITAAGNHLVFAVQPNGGSAGVPWTSQPVIEVLDGNNNLVSTDNSSFVTLAIGANPAGGTLSCTSSTTVQLVGGEAAFSGCSINIASPNAYTLVAQSTAAYTAATSNPFLISGTGLQLVFTTQPGGGTTNIPWSQQPVVSVENNLGQVITTDNSTVVTLTLNSNPTGATLSCTSGNTLVVVAGSASFSGCSLNIASPSAYTLLASSNPVDTPATSSAFLVSDNGLHLAFINQPSGGAAGQAFAQQPSVAVENTSNQVVTTDNSTIVSLGIGTNPAGGTLSCTGGTATTVVGGIATFSGCSINNASSAAYTLTANSTPADAPATSGAFLISNAVAGTETLTAETAIDDSGDFSESTKVVQVGDTITLAIQTSPSLAGQRLGIWIAKKTNGEWSAFSPHTSVLVGSDGTASYVYAAGSTAWLSFIAKAPATATTAASSSHGRQAEWVRGS
jgi:hypothetical protein